MFFKKEPIITFKCDPELRGAIPDPTPASECIPKWFRKMPYDDGPGFNTVKRCIPFKDAMSMGYIIPLWLDINVCNDGDRVSFGYQDLDVFGGKVFGNHLPMQIEGCPIRNTTYGNQPMKFFSPWLITTPPGWSCMFIQPINHFDGRLHIITGVVDTDKYKSNVNFPFIWMDKKFNGIIPQGTPLVQVIPFKRTEWNHKISDISQKDCLANSNTINKINSVFKNYYRLNLWTPKRYK